jgi:hypothetical protein
VVHRGDEAPAGALGAGGLGGAKTGEALKHLTSVLSPRDR